MFYYVLRSDLEQDVRHFATRYCLPGDCVIERNGALTVAFREEDRATLFLNLFDDEIQRSFEVADRSAA
jgi:hypothetical protein